MALPASARAQKASDTLRIQFIDAVPNVDMYFNSQRTGLILAHHAWDMLVHRDPVTFELGLHLSFKMAFKQQPQHQPCRGKSQSNRPAGKHKQAQA